MLEFQVKAAVETLHFWDGVRRIDMVLAYKDPEVENEIYEDSTSVDTLNEDESPDEKEEKRKHEREVFEKNLVDAGLELELEPSQVKLKANKFYFYTLSKYQKNAII